MAKKNEEEPIDMNPPPQEITPDMAPAPLPQPDSMAILARLAQAMELLATRQAQAPNDSRVEELMAKVAGAIERMAESNIQGSQIIANETRRAHRPSNEIVHGRSVFNQRGNLLPADATGPIKPKLKCIMMIPWIVEWESCTREEVELLNLLEPGEFVVARTDRSRIRVNVMISYAVDGVTPSRLVIHHDTGFNNDNFKMMVSLVDMLRQILKQTSPAVRRAADLILSDEEEEALIEAGELTVSQ